jgi:hypothetical protein
MSIYGRLGFNSGDPTTSATVSQYTSGVANNMALMPQLLNTWQTQDLGDSNAGNYFVNPVAPVTANIISLSLSTVITLNTVTSSVSSSVTNVLTNIVNTANVIVNTAGPNYLYVTNRESNVVDPETDSTTVHYKIAIGYGQILSYLTYQSDGVQNNSPMMGNFTSITLGNTLNALYSTFSTQYNDLANTITRTNTIDTWSNTSNISLSTAQSFSNTVNSIIYLMTTYPAQDNAFFTNSKNIINDYSKISPLSNMGSTETYLAQNFIGTDKLKSRINSQ